MKCSWKDDTSATTTSRPAGDGFDHRNADVAGRHRPQTGCLQHGGDEGGDGGLPVGAGDGDQAGPAGAVGERGPPARSRPVPAPRPRRRRSAAGGGPDARAGHHQVAARQPVGEGRAPVGTGSTTTAASRRPSGSRGRAVVEHHDVVAGGQQRPGDRPAGCRRSRRRQPGGRSPVATFGQEIGVEGAQGHGRAQSGQDPEPDDHGRLGPAEQLEVVVDGRHAEDPAPE